MAKLTLDWEEEYPYIVLGIAASLSDYRLCWNLNKTFQFAFNRQEPILVYNKRKDKIFHSFYEFEDLEYNIKYRCIENKNGGSRFLPEVPQADYLLVIDETYAIDPDVMIRKIKDIPQVLLAFRIHLDQLKNKQNLMLLA